MVAVGRIGKDDRKQNIIGSGPRTFSMKHLQCQDFSARAIPGILFCNFNCRSKILERIQYVLCNIGKFCLMPNSWTYNFVKVSGHNLESSRTRGFYMDFLGKGYGFLSHFLFFLYSVMYSNWTLSCRGGWNRKKKSRKTFVWISTKNSASVLAVAFSSSLLSNNRATAQ